MRVGFGTTVLARGLEHGGIDGIGSYTWELGRALLSTVDVDLFPAGYRSYCAGDIFPGTPTPMN